METQWESSLNYTFDDIAHITKIHITPIIKKINKMSNMIFKIPSHKMILPHESMFKYLNIEYTIIWQESTTVAKFQEFIKILNIYNNAKILTTRFVDSSMVELYFNKGMFSHDPSRIELQLNDSLDNYYRYLTDAKIKDKWTSIFEETKLVTIRHQYMNIKISITGIKDTEYHFYNRLIKTLQNTWYNTVKNIKTVDTEIKNNQKLKQSVKSLKQVDPKLYIAKFPDGSPMIYSRLCQKDNQPKISQTKVPGGIKFINYTNNF